MVRSGATGATTTSEAVAILPVPPFVEVTAPVVLSMVRADAPVTFTTKVQELLATMTPAESVTLVAPAAAVIDPPPHEPLRPAGVLTTSPDGRASVTATPVSAADAFG